MSADEQGYNGWRNYETWAANLHMTNDAQSAEYWRGAAIEAIEGTDSTHSVFSHREWAEFRLCDRMRDEAEANAPEIDGMYADLLNAALSEVIWLEIARHIMESAWDEHMKTEDEETADA